MLGEVFTAFAGGSRGVRLAWQKQPKIIVTENQAIAFMGYLARRERGRE